MADNQQQDNQQNQQVTFHPGGLEGAGVSVEPHMESGPSANAETISSPESGSERQGERAKEIQTQKLAPQSQPQSAPPKQKKSDFTPPTNAPKVFGYNIPAKFANNPKLVSRNAGKGNPKKSVTWLYVALDRLLKMQSS